MTKSLFCGVLAWASACSAGPITYNVNQTVGLGSVTGTITTDGNSGNLVSADISAFNLTISDGVSTFQLVSTLNFAEVLNSGLSATPTALSFDYGQNAGFLIEAFGMPVPGNNTFVCWEGASFNCTGGPAGIDICINCPSGLNTGAAELLQSGTQQIASAAGAGTVTPEPSSFLLVGLGAGVLGYGRRKWILQRSGCAASRVLK